MRIGIIGITGRMGSLLSEIIKKDDTIILSGGISSVDSKNDMEILAKTSDVFIDFSSPQSTVNAVKIAVQAKIPFISGTTDLSSEQFAILSCSSKNIPVLHSANFSIGIQLVGIFLKKCSEILRGYDASIIDKHHNKKKDSPSGTALFLSEKIGRHSQILSIRSGNMPGDHICEFVGENDMLTISHRTFDRRVFAEGALNCAKWIIGKAPGNYNMLDFMNIKDGF